MARLIRNMMRVAVMMSMVMEKHAKVGQQVLTSMSQ